MSSFSGAADDAGGIRQARVVKAVQGSDYAP